MIESYRPTAAMVAAAKRASERSVVVAAVAAGEPLTLGQVQRLHKARAWDALGGAPARRWSTQIVARADALAKARRAVAIYGDASWRSFALAHAAPAHARAELLRKAGVYARNADAVVERAAQLGMHIEKARRLAGRLTWRGLDISVEQAVGDERHWYDPHNDTRGTTYMHHAYGYIRGTEGADGDHVDVYVGPMLDDADEVYIIHQVKAPDFRRYDEDKVMLGFGDAAAAKQAYLRQYNDPRFYGGMSVMSADAFEARCKAGVKGKVTCKAWAWTAREALRALRKGV